MSLIAAPRKAIEPQLAADISSNNSVFDPAAYASAGHLLITIKATQGLDYVNQFWDEWTHGAHEHKLAVNHYHFAELVNPVSEAQFFWLTVRKRFMAGVDRIMIDIETGEQADWPAYLDEFDAELHRLSGLSVIGYTFASALSSDLRLRSSLWMVAAWGTQRPGNLLLGLPCGRLWAWQYTGGLGSPSGGPTGTAGIPGAIDLSVLRNATVRNLRRDRARHF